MAKIIIPIATGFEEIEAVSIIDVCRRAGIEVIVAGVDSLRVIGANKISINTDILLNEVNSSDIDMIVLPGGGGGTQILASNEKVQTMLQEFKLKNKFIAAICAAPYALHQAGVLNEKYTCYPSFEKKIRDKGYQSSEDIVIDGNVITSRGPGTAMHFALQLVKILTNDNIYNEVKKGLLAKHC